MSSGLFSVLFYNSARLEETRQAAGYAIIAQLYKKLDSIHADTSKQINIAGNVSESNNDQLTQIIHLLKSDLNNKTITSSSH
jgi:hypothetical protein